MVVDIASVAPENKKIRPNFPVDLSPWNSVRFSYKSNKFLKIPGTIDYMFGSNLAVIIYVWFGFAAV